MLNIYINYKYLDKINKINKTVLLILPTVKNRNYYYVLI